MKKILDALKEFSEEDFADFTHKTIPTVERKKFLGVRTPVLRKMAKDLRGDPVVKKFLAELPHKYFEENQLHGFLISDIMDFDEALRETERFLPFIDNWATCDQTSPKAFKNHKEELLPSVIKWIESGRIFTIRFGIVTLMKLFLDDAFNAGFLQKVAAVQNEDYYVKMAAAWFFAEALAKQWDSAVKIIEGRRLDAWTHNKAIQKARESYRISAEQKKYLLGLKVKNEKQNK